MKMKYGPWTSILFLILPTQFHISAGIGMNLGTVANDLASPVDIINFFKNCTIKKIRLYEPNPTILDALRNSGLGVSIGVRNEDLQNLGDPQAATDWVNTNIVPYTNDVSFQYITLGNEVVPGPLSQYVPQAITNIHNALVPLGLTTSIKVTSVISMVVLENSSPPSTGTFSDGTFPVMRDIISVLNNIGSPIMLNVYPYFAYAADPQHISVEFATFQSKVPVVVDGPYQYYNLFDAMVDAFNAAIEKVNIANVSIAISETGWPTAGNEPYSSKDNAQQYNVRLFWHVFYKGTPRRPGQLMDTFIFDMFNENLKTSGVEQNFGAFYANMKEVYPFLPCGY